MTLLLLTPCAKIIFKIREGILSKLCLRIQWRSWRLNLIIFCHRSDVDYKIFILDKHYSLIMLIFF